MINNSVYRHNVNNQILFDSATGQIKLVKAKELADSIWYTDAQLTAYYRFSTTALTTDSSGEGHTLTAISDPAEVTGVFGKAADFDGNDAYSATDHADFQPTGDFTVGLWVDVLNNAALVNLFQSYSQNTFYAGFLFRISAAGIIVFLSGKNSGATTADFEKVQSTTVIDDGNWHFIVGTYDGSYLRIYIDGVMEQEVAWANAPAYAATNYVRVGCQNVAGTNTNFLTGTLDDVFLINGAALTLEQIQDLYGSI